MLKLMSFEREHTIYFSKVGWEVRGRETHRKLKNQNKQKEVKTFANNCNRKLEIIVVCINVLPMINPFSQNLFLLCKRDWARGSRSTS